MPTTIRLKGGGIAAMRTVGLADTGALVSHDYVTVQTSGGTTQQETLQDAVFNVYTAATYHREGNVSVQGMADVEIVNLTPSVGTVAEDGGITRLSSGILKLLIKNSIITLSLNLDLTDKTEEVDQPAVYVSTVAGSLAEHLSDAVDSRIDNTMTMNTNGKIYSTQDHSTPSYVRNINLWCADIDLTCISPWNSRNSNKRAGTLITPRHVLNAAHYPLSNGDTIRFIEADGTVHTRTIAGTTNHPDYSPHYPDLRLYTLDSDLPAAITPCTVMPADWNEYLVNNSDNRPAALLLDQEEKALVADLRTNSAFNFPTDADRMIFSESLISGDSGNPGFLIVNGELVLVTVWTYGGAGSGTPVSDNIADLNAMIATTDAQAGVSTGYTVTEADFSAFPNYS